MIEIQNLSKHYGRIKAVNNLNFTIQKGEVLGFLGPNGAGKSTTMNMITGFIPPTDGTVKVNGFDILDNPNEVKKHIGYLPELPPLYMDMTVKDYLDFASDLKQAGKDKPGRFDDIMDLVKIGDVQNRLIKNLSKGYKQRVGLAQALIGNPDVLILDEPTVGLDPKQIIEIRRLIKSLGEEHTIILSSHILPEVSAVCERVVIINKGEIAAIDSPENLSKGFGPAARISIAVEGEKDAVLACLKGVAGVKSVQLHLEKEDNVSHYIIEAERDSDVRKPLFFALAEKSYPILELKAMDISLEDIFLQLTTDEEEVEQ